MLTQCLLDKLGVTVDQPIKLPMFSGLTLKISSNSVLAYPEECHPLQWQFLLRELQTYLGNEHNVKTVIGSSVIDEIGNKWLKLELVHVLPDHRTTRQNQDMPSDEIDLELLDDEDGSMNLDEPMFPKGGQDESPRGLINPDQVPSNTSSCPPGYVYIADLASYKLRASIEPERMTERSGGLINDLAGITKLKKLGLVSEKVFNQLKQLADEQPNCAEAIELVRNALYASYLSSSPAIIPNLPVRNTSC